ncbi:YVTN beta-propeller repeat-containing protein, partial [mine drainage metagenome]
SIIDTQTLTITKTFPVPGGPDDMEVSEDGKELWITNRWIRQVSVVDLSTDKVVRTIPVGKSPHGIFFEHHAARQ